MNVCPKCANVRRVQVRGGRWVPCPRCVTGTTYQRKYAAEQRLIAAATVYHRSQGNAVGFASAIRVAASAGTDPARIAILARISTADTRRIIAGQELFPNEGVNDGA